MKIEDLDHPLVFLIAITLGVLATEKLLSYVAGKAGLPELNKWLLNQP